MVLNQIILTKKKMFKNVMGNIPPHFICIFQEEQKLNTQVNCRLFSNTGSVADCTLNFETEQAGSVMRATSGEYRDCGSCILPFLGITARSREYGTHVNQVHIYIFI